MFLFQTFQVKGALAPLSNVDFFIRMSLLSCQDEASLSVETYVSYVCELILHVLACKDADKPSAWEKIHTECSFGLQQALGHDLDLY